MYGSLDSSVNENISRAGSVLCSGGGGACRPGGDSIFDTWMKQGGSHGNDPVTLVTSAYGLEKRLRALVVCCSLLHLPFRVDPTSLPADTPGSTL